MSGAWARGSVAIGGQPRGVNVGEVLLRNAAAAVVPSPSSAPSTTGTGGGKSTGSIGSPIATKVKKLFDYYLVLDFEATCDDQVRLADQEIIEFPCVLVDAESCSVVSEFQRYVRPVRNPKLTTFCTQLTGIQQSTVDKAATFSTVLQEFLAWIDEGKLGVAPPHRSFAVVTCGDWDLKTMLPLQLSLCEGELRSSGVTPATLDYFQRWVNIKNVFARHLTPKGSRSPKSMVDMLQLVNKPLVGRHHSGIDDCRNIATCVIEVLKRGYPVDYTWLGRESSASAPPRFFGAPVPPPARSVIDTEPNTPVPPPQADEGKRRGKKTPVTSRVEEVALLPPIAVDESKEDAAESIAAAATASSAGAGTIPTLTPMQTKDFSKRISWLLRHGALSEGLPMSLNGFVPVDGLMNRVGPRLTLPILAQIVISSDKQRFAMKYGADGLLYIRANQGHSIEGIAVDMHQVTDPAEIPVAVHGTYYEAWQSIKTQGLSRMTRQHIHFAKGLPGDSGVISGMRKSCELLVYLNVPKALAEGIPLLLSSNGVVLSPGLEGGLIPPLYFQKVVDIRTGVSLL